MHAEQACLRVLREHKANIWKWPRESDLMADLVTYVRAALAEPFTRARLVSGDEAISEISTIGEAFTPRVRTEVKIPKSGEKDTQNGSYKLDLCILRAAEQDRYPTLYVSSPKRPRDILLRVDSSDIAEIIEVKLDPHPMQYWLKDLAKLHLLRESFPELRCTSMHLLSIDNYLAQSVNYPQRKRFPLSSDMKPDQLHRCLYQGVKFKIQLQMMERFSLSSSAPRQLESGIYLWAFGSDGRTPNHISPCLWKVEASY